MSGAEIFCWSIAVFLVVWLVVMIGHDVYKWRYNKTLRYEVTPATSRVIKKDFKGSYTTTSMMRIGKTWFPQVHTHPEKYNVCLFCWGKSYTLNNRKLYDSVKVNDIIPVSVHTGYDKKGDIKEQYITLRTEEE